MERENSTTVPFPVVMGATDNEVEFSDEERAEVSRVGTQPFHIPSPLRSNVPLTPASQELSNFSFSSPYEMWDCVHFRILLPLAVAIFLDKRPVQRLRFLLQLGNTYHRFTGATHKRYEHSVGVAYGAMEMAENASRDCSFVPKCFWEEMSEKDLLCIGIAGLCHDLGHGPLSHLFESVVNEVYKPSAAEEKWRHEDMSVFLLRAMWKEMSKELKEMSFTDEDLCFIELLITGIAPSDPWPDNVGRSNKKRWMTDIICNKRNGFDVDKMDYIPRDTKHAFSEFTFSMQSIYKSARVLVKNGNTYIAYDKECRPELVELFRNRSFLFKKVYWDPVVKVIDLMVKDAFRALGPNFKVTCGDHRCTLWDCVKSVEDYLFLDDSLLDTIKSEASGEARLLLERIDKREYYPILLHIVADDTTSLPKYRKLLEERVSQSVWKKLLQWEKQHGTEAFHGEKLTVSQVSADEGSGKEGLEAITIFDSTPQFNNQGNDEGDVVTESLYVGKSFPSEFLLILRAEEFLNEFSNALTADHEIKNVSEKEENKASEPAVQERKRARSM